MVGAFELRGGRTGWSEESPCGCLVGVPRGASPCGTPLAPSVGWTQWNEERSESRGRGGCPPALARSRPSRANRLLNRSPASWESLPFLLLLWLVTVVWLAPAVPEPLLSAGPGVEVALLLHHPPSLASAGCVPARFSSAMDSTPAVAAHRCLRPGFLSVCREVAMADRRWFSLLSVAPDGAGSVVGPPGRAPMRPPNDVFASPSSFSSLGGMRSDEISTCNGLDPGGGGSSPSPPGSLFRLLGEGRATVRDPGSQGSLRPPNDVFASLSSFSSLGGMRSDEISICNGLDPGGGGHAPPHLGVGTFLCGNEQLGDPRFHHRDARPPELGHPKVRRLRTRSRAGFPGSSPPTPLGAGDVGWPCLGASRTRRATSTQGAFIT